MSGSLHSNSSRNANSLHWVYLLLANVFNMCDFDDYYYDDEEAAYSDCPKCGRSYDEIDYEYQSCSKCGWDADKETWGKIREPTDADYQMGDADILTGRWY